MAFFLSLVIIIVGVTVAARYLPVALTWFFNKFPNQFAPLEADPTPQSAISPQQPVPVRFREQSPRNTAPTTSTKTPLPLH